MDIREVLDAMALAKAGQVHEAMHAIQNALSRFDLDSSVDRLVFVNGYGHLVGLPTRPGQSSTATTGVPTNAIVGFAPGAVFLNFKGTTGTLFYVNTGTNASATWTNVI